MAAQDGNAPAFLARTNSKGVPITILMVQATIFTVLCSVFLMMPTVSSSYWVLTAMTAQLAMFVYIALFAAALWLRYKRPDVARPYTIPFGMFGMWVTCVLGLVSCFVAIGLGFFPPSQLTIGSVTVYELILVVGIVVLSVPPLIIYAWTQAKQRRLKSLERMPHG